MNEMLDINEMHDIYYKNEIISSVHPNGRKIGYAVCKHDKSKQGFVVIKNTDGILEEINFTKGDTIYSLVSGFLKQIEDIQSKKTEDIQSKKTSK